MTNKKGIKNNSTQLQKTQKNILIISYFKLFLRQKTFTMSASKSDLASDLRNY